MPIKIDEEGVHLSHWIKVDKVTLELLNQDDEFANFMKKCIRDEIDRRMKRALETWETKEKEK